MEDLRGIGQSLPPSTDQAEKDLSASFKVAAASLAGLFKVGRRATQQAFRAGKREALQDVLEFIQASLDHPAATAHGGSSAAGSATAPSGNVTARLIDYLEARQLTLQAEEDDEDESENPPRSAPAPAPTARPSMFTNRAAAASTSQLPSTSTPLPTASNSTSNAGASRRHEPHPSTSSSAPSSPQHHREQDPHQSYRTSSAASTSTSTSHFNFGPILTPSTAPSSPLASSATGAPSPLTRLQARREREHVKERKGGGHKLGAGNSGNAVIGGSSVTDGPGGVGDAEDLGQALLVGNMKRRWGTVSMAEVDLDGANPVVEVGSPEGEVEVEEVGGEADKMEFEGMEMDGWDGRTERPSKRLVRRA